MIQRILKLPRQFRLSLYESEPGLANARTSPPDCVLDASKLLATGVNLRAAPGALGGCLTEWEHLSSSLTTFA